MGTPEVDVAAELGRRLRARRTLLGRTIASVALDAGLSVPYIANLENGRGNPTLAALLRLAGALGVRLRDLLDLEAADDQPSALPAWPASLRQFSEHRRFRRESRRLAEDLGADERGLRAGRGRAGRSCSGGRHGRDPARSRGW